MRIIRSVSVRTRLLAALLLVSLVPATLVGVFANKVYQDLAISEFSAFAVNAVGGINSSLSSELGVFSRMIDQVSVDDNVQIAMARRLAGIELRRAADNYLVRNNRYYRGLCVLDAAGDSLYTTGPVRVEEEDAPRLVRAIDAASPSDSLYFYDGTYGPTRTPTRCLALGRRIYRFSAGTEHIGYIITIIDSALAEDEIFSRSQIGGGAILMTTSDGVAIAGENATPGEIIADSPVYRGIIAAKADGRGSFVENVDGEPTFFAFGEDGSYNVYFVASVPLAAVGESSRNLQWQTAALVAVTTLSCVALSTLVFRSIAQPINRIVEQCRKPSVEGVGDMSPDELGFLARAVDQYAANIEALARAREQDMVRKREMELETLQYQINPHFLFNTLGTIKWAAVMEGGSSAVSDGLTSLTRLLRNVLMNTDEMIPLREELENLRHYFVIQKIRYADYFYVQNDIDETALDYRVPRFILQPLAENAVMHGTEGGRRKIVVGVRCALVKEGVLLEISDNGAGFDVERIMTKSRQNYKFTGIGLSNVDERLKLYYGNDHGLIVKSVPGNGATCGAIIPIREGEPDRAANRGDSLENKDDNAAESGREL